MIGQDFVLSWIVRTNQFVCIIVICYGCVSFDSHFQFPTGCEKVQYVRLIYSLASLELEYWQILYILYIYGS